MYNSIPKKPRFNCAEEKARQVLLYYKVNTLPIDVRKLIKASNICVIKCYSKLIKRHSLKKEDLYESFGKDGAVLYDATKPKPYTIVYNDIDKPTMRITWTLAHELGHIVLKHHVEFDETRLMRCGLIDRDYKILDAEADAFAAELLAPVIVMITANWDTKDSIMQHCGLSVMAARIRSRSLRSIKQIKECYFKYERNLYYAFYNYIHLKFCPECKTFFVSKDANYCPICGSHSIIWKKGEINIMKYEGVNVNELSKAIVCPICQNEEILENGDYCAICGTYLVNHCSDITDEYDNIEKQGCGTLLPGNARYCPYCGNPSHFKQINALCSWEQEQAIFKSLESGKSVPFDEEIPF